MGLGYSKLKQEMAETLMQERVTLRQEMAETLRQERVTLTQEMAVAQEAAMLRINQNAQERVQRVLDENAQLRSQLMSIREAVRILAVRWVAGLLPWFAERHALTMNGGVSCKIAAGWE